MRNIGTHELDKGNMGGLQMIMFDAVPRCEDTCVMYETCNYKNGVKCKLKKTYIEKILQNLDSAVAVKDQTAVMQIGLMIVPLFMQLITFKIHAASLDDIMLGTRIHPVYAEIRATIKDINLILRNMGVTQAKMKSRGSGLDLLNGNSSYYDDVVKKGTLVA